MSDLDVVLAENRNAVRDFLAAAEGCDAIWRTPRAPGKWSPSQVSEHVARALEESANEIEGGTSKFPRLPALFRPVARAFLFNRVLKTQAFPKARTSKPFNPELGPASPAQARARLEAAVARLDRACRARAAGERVQTVTFGRVSVTDYAKFQGLHVRHHRRQLPDASAGVARP